MLQDARKLRPGTEVAADVCIVGAGAAGLTIARALQDSPLDVCVLESGGFEADAATQDLYRGTVAGQPYPALERTRTRFLGGSTNCWQGFCRPLDPIDFRARDWLPHSGWPLDRNELDPYYALAQQALELGPYDYRPERWQGPGDPPAPLSSELVRDQVFQYGRGPLRMGAAYRSALEAAPRTRVLLHANARLIDLDESARRVKRIEAQCLDGPRIHVRARAYVLATGGIENPRLLLASRNVQPRGIGNENDLVGRFFMEHPHLRFHATFLAHTTTGLQFYDRRAFGENGNLARGILTPRESWLHREQLLNYAVQLRASPAVIEDELEQALSAATAETDDGGAGPARRYPLIFHCEQAPNPASRVTLTSEKDALGTPRVELDWRLLDIDRRSARRAHEGIAQALGSSGRGRVQILLDDDEAQWPADMTGGNHHMGTTRMHDDPKQGVVNARSYVHGISNLLVAGSSVFPTSGAANPTLTLVALAFRTAEQLRKDFS